MTVSKVLLAVALLVVPAVAEAQAVPAAAWTFVYCASPAVPNAATCPSISQVALLGATVLCNQATLPAPTGPVTNPATIQWDDPLITGRSCVSPRPTPTGGPTGPPLPAGTYVGMLFADGGSPGIGSSPRSAPTATFTIVVPLPPLTPTNVIVR